MASSVKTFRYLYIPIEVAVRELEAKLLVAHYALRSGFEVVLGQKWLLERNLPNLPPGVMLFKTANGVDAPHMAEARMRGFGVAVIDEEVIGLADFGHALRLVSPKAVAACDVIYALGPAHGAALRARFPDWPGAIVETGNPRLDLLRPGLRGFLEPEAQALREANGRYFLINTNFKRANAYKQGLKDLLRNLRAATAETASRWTAAKQILDAWRFESGNMRAFRRLARAIVDDFPDHRLVLRPHPVEDMDKWRQALDGLPRAEVRRDGSAAAWILGSEALIHNSCTTGTEAYCLGVPSISYQPVRSYLLDRFLSNQVSRPAKRQSEVLGLLGGVAEGHADGFYPAGARQVFEKHIAGATGAMSAERLAQDLATRYGVADAPRLGWSGGVGLTEVRAGARSAHKLEGLDMAAVTNRLTRIGSALGRELDIAVDEVADRTFHLVPRGG